MSVREYNKREESMNQCRKYSKTMLTMRDLGIKEVSSNCQKRNGTQVFSLPFKDAYGHGIEFATYNSGYVRKLVTYNTRGAKCYQINKTRKVDGDFYKITTGPHAGLFRQWDHTERILIPNHGDRIEYLLKFILRNYFVAKPKYNHVINMEMLDRVAKYSRGVKEGFDACSEYVQNEILESLQR